MSESISSASTAARAATATGSALPVLRLPAVVLPGMVVTLTLDDHVNSALRAAIAADGRVLLVSAVADHPTKQLATGELGVVAAVPNIANLPTGQQAAIVQAEVRARVSAVRHGERSGTYAEVELLADPKPTPRLEASARDIQPVLGDIARLRGSRRLPELLAAGLPPGALADAIAGWADDDGLRSQVLQAIDVTERLKVVADWAAQHRTELQVSAKIRNDVTEGVDKQQREFLLRQQLSAIRNELGEGDDDVVAHYRAQLAEVERSLSESAVQHITKEIDRLERMSNQSAEHGWVRTWLDRIFEVPWATLTNDTLDVHGARQRLDADHFGLDDVKQRIVEFLAVRKLRADRGVGDDRRAGSVLTLVGPPGVGKTSLGESIAGAMGRNFVRVALGGVRDEAEVRGHRRTYVASQPGRIVRAIVEAGSMNPVVLLDEVDKLASGGWSGDPTAALLEVLDPAQNHTFRDHYLEVDLDLSNVVFIATANVADAIPGPLLDRMDLIRLDGYTEDEKVFIAQQYLVPRQVERAGLTADEVVVDERALRAIISGYTREAGVRGLERELGRLCRKIAAKVATDVERPPVSVEAEAVVSWLGRQKVDDAIPERTDTPGIATGLAVTGLGGDVLFVETTAFELAHDSEPTLTLTGQLGDVMKESAHIALSFLRSHAAELGVDPQTLNRRVHVHVPAGAVPKDGPSAGVTITTALISLLTGKVVKPSVGMTGEITLQGKVLPIGGVKQKVLAAHRAGLTEVVLPARNGPDLDDVPERVREQMTFHLAHTYADVLAAAFA